MTTTKRPTVKDKQAVYACIRDLGQLALLAIEQKREGSEEGFIYTVELPEGWKVTIIDDLIRKIRNQCRNVTLWDYLDDNQNRIDCLTYSQRY